MSFVSNSPKYLFLCAALALPATGSLTAQELPNSDGEVMATVVGTPPADLSGLPAGPEIEGIISARKGDRIQVTSTDGSRTTISVSEGTEIKSSGGFLGMNRAKLTSASLLNGLPVSVKTLQWGEGLVAGQIALKGKDLRTANMIRTGTEQGFSEQTAATEALRGRMADIDKYNIKGTTNVYFDSGKWVLSNQAKADLCTAATEADGTENALMLVVGYTDSDGSEEYNQELSEKRAGRVINHLQQACRWKPWRMLTPTGMAESDPMADNSTPEGKAQNRRVSVNILVSKSVDGM